MRYPVVFWDSGGTIFRGDLPDAPDTPSPSQVRAARAFRALRVLEMFGCASPADLDQRIDELEAGLQTRLGPWYSLEALAAGIHRALELGERPEEALFLADALSGPRYRAWLWDGVAEALGALHGAGVRMGLIANTDWTGRMMRRALAGVRLENLFGPVI